jgi:hypothetical protein
VKDHTGRPASKLMRSASRLVLSARALELEALRVFSTLLPNRGHLPI